MTKILIIDDEAPIRRVLRDILENESYQVDDAATGMEALMGRVSRNTAAGYDYQTVQASRLAWGV